MNILYQSDDNYAGYLGVSLTSLLITNSNSAEITIVIIDDNISDANKNKIESIVKQYRQKLYWINADEIRDKTIVSQWPKYNSFRKNTNCMLKYYIFDKLKELNINRIMYIDSDSVVTGNLSELFDCDMGGKTIGMTRCCLVTEKYIDAINYDQTKYYYNAGMNLFDVNKWIEKRYPDKLIERALNDRAYSTVDQDLLNLVVADDVYDLGCKYNYQCIHDAFPSPCYSSHYKGYKYYSANEIEEAERDHRIIHFMRFCGQYPWNLYSTHPNKEIYEYYRQKSPWSDETETITKNNSYKFKIERILYKILPRVIFIKIFRYYHQKMILDSDKKARTAKGDQ